MRHFWKLKVSPLSKSSPPAFCFEKEVLHNINISVPEKTVTALTGLSGSGKKTIMNVLARFWEIKSRRITIGGEKQAIIKVVFFA
ncbi:ATP-binding cassette domain-containing protein [Treponema sp. HNW]